MAIELDGQQLKAISQLENGKILKGGVGSGKTRTALAYFFIKVCEGRIRVNGKGDYSEMRKPRDLYIITTAKKRDSLEWEKECASFGLSTDEEAGHPGMKVVIDSWNNIGNYKEVKDAVFLLDEQRLVGSGAWVKAFIKIARANHWIMLSATPGDSWMDYVPVFVANDFYKNRTEFVRRHVVYNTFSKYPKIDRYVETGRLNKLRSQILVEMPHIRHTVRRPKNVIVDYDVELFNKAYVKRWHPYEERPIKDVGELFRVMRKIVNSDKSRMEALMKLYLEHPRIIVFYNFDYELEILRDLTSTWDIQVAEYNGHKHESVPEGKKWMYLVQYTAGAEAWNCTTTDTMVFWSLNYSYKINEQAKGRIDRRDTPYTDLHYFIFRSNSVIDNAIVRSLAGKRNFNEKELVREL